MLNEEIQQAHKAGLLTLSDMVLDSGLKRRFSIDRTLCDDTGNLQYCLYLYLYALESWCCEGLNFISEVELIAILSKVEELQKQCCVIGEDAIEPELGPSMPIARNGFYIDGDPDNPATISELATATNGSILWYDAPTGGTGSAVAPDLPPIGLHEYWISQINDQGESIRLKITVQVIPAQITTQGLIACENPVGSPIEVIFEGLHVDGTIMVYSSTGMSLGSSLYIPVNAPHNANYTVVQSVNGQQSQPFGFTVIVHAVPVLGSISVSPVDPPLIGTDVPPTVFSVIPVPGIISYIWTTPMGVITTGNQISMHFTNATPVNISVKGVTATGCETNIVTKIVEPEIPLDGVYYLSVSDENETDRVFTANVNLRNNPDDTIHYTMTVIDNPLGAIIAPGNSIVTSPGITATHPVMIDASANHAGGTVHIRYTITHTSGGAPIESPSTIDVIHTFEAEPYCAPGYTLSEDETFCYLDEVMPATVTQSNYCLAKTGIVEYAVQGTRIYSIGFNPASAENWSPTPGEIAFTRTNIPQWRSNGPANGPFNRAAVWIDSNCDGTPNALVGGAQATLAFMFNNVGPQRTIYVGIGGDNNYRLVVNGTTIVNTTTGGVINFTLWHVFPITVEPGLNYINAVATGDGSVSDAIAMTVYDNTAAEIAAATNDDQLNILFSTQDQVGQTVDIATCAPGWSLDISAGPGNYVCRRRLTTPPII